jgi:ankyrin repeat protein
VCDSRCEVSCVEQVEQPENADPDSFLLPGLQNGLTPIYAASSGGHLNIVDLLIAAGARVNAANEVALHLLTLLVMMHHLTSLPRPPCAFCCFSLLLHLFRVSHS